MLGRGMRGVQHRENFLFHEVTFLFLHEATFLGLLDENPFCLAPGTFTVALGLSFEFLIRGQAGRGSTRTHTAADEGTHALGKARREEGYRRVWRVRTSTPCDIGVLIIVVIRAVVALYSTRVRVDPETRAEWRRRPCTRVVVAIHGRWLIRDEKVDKEYGNL